MTLSEDADLATDLVTRAAELALQMRSAGLRGEQKTSVSDVVTAADRAAEKLIREELNRLRPEDGVMGEEGTLQEGTSGRTWVIDPVDGTYNFLQGSPTGARPWRCATTPPRPVTVFLRRRPRIPRSSWALSTNLRRTACGSA